MKNDKKNIFNMQLNMDGATHSALLVVIGGYLVYMAYEMIRDTLGGVSSMSLTTTIILAGLMALGGLGVVGYGAWAALRSMKAKKDAAQKSSGKEVAADEE